METESPRGLWAATIALTWGLCLALFSFCTASQPPPESSWKLLKRLWQTKSAFQKSPSKARGGGVHDLLASQKTSQTLPTGTSVASEELGVLRGSQPWAQHLQIFSSNGCQSWVPTPTEKEGPLYPSPVEPEAPHFNSADSERLDSFSRALSTICDKSMDHTPLSPPSCINELFKLVQKQPFFVFVRRSILKRNHCN